MSTNIRITTATAFSIAIATTVFYASPSSSFTIPLLVQRRKNPRSFSYAATTSTAIPPATTTTNLFAEEENKTRRNILGLAVPFTVALIANAPFLAVMSKPPTQDERETMLTEWCKGEYCTLLGGGAGYFEGASATVDAV